MFGNIRGRFIFEVWKKIHRLSQASIGFWQLRELRRIAKHAYENTALYRELWDKRAVKPEDMKTLSDIEHFPIVNKGIFLGHPVEAYVNLKGKQPYIWKKTSGSTGQPFSFIYAYEKNPLYDIFRSYRFLCWQGFSPEAILKSPRVVINTVATSKITRPFFANFPISEFLSKREKVLKEIFQMQPISLVSYPSLLVEFARAVTEFPQFKNLGIKYAVSSGEDLTRSQRKFIGDTLCCEVYDRYGLEEFEVIGTECRYHNGFHINVETFLLEIVDENGSRVPSGETGRIVITDFRNYTMPFIRYDTGDRGHFLSDRCQCGLDGLLLMVEGRVGEFLTLGSRKIHSMEIDGIMEGFSGAVLQYQVVKINENTITLSIIPGPGMNMSVLDNIQEKVKALIGTVCQLKIELVSEIKRTPRGKCQTLINGQEKCQV